MSLDERMSVEKFRELQAAAGAGKKGRQPESYVVSAAVDLAARYRWKARKFRESPFGVKGCPDLLLSSPTGVHVWAEAKRPATSRSPGGRVRPAQRAFLLEERSFLVPSCVFDAAFDLLPVFHAVDILAATDALLVHFGLIAGETPGPTEGETPSDVYPWR